MKVSVIIPVYNVEDYIVECLESVAAQTYDGEMECLVVDDCGTDSSIPKAEEYIRTYQGKIRFQILHHDHNRGLSAARNTGTAAATGDYIYYLDSDDAIIPDAIEEMMQVVYKHPQVEMVQGGIICMNGLMQEDFTTRNLPEYTDDKKWMVSNVLFSLPVSSWNRLLKRDFLLREEITFHEGIIHEDVPYSFMIALKCRHIGFVRENTYVVRTHREGSITNTPQEERAVQSRFIVMHDCITTFRLHSFENKKLYNIALRALWWKWRIYMKIHSLKVLSGNKGKIKEISRSLIQVTPWPWKGVAHIYDILPLIVKH